MRYLVFAAMVFGHQSFSGPLDDIRGLSWPMVVSVKLGVSDRALHVVGERVLADLILGIHKASERLRDAMPQNERHLFRWPEGPAKLRGSQLTIFFTAFGDDASRRSLGPALGEAEKAASSGRPITPVGAFVPGVGAQVFLIVHADRLQTILYRRDGKPKQDADLQLFLLLGAAVAGGVTQYLALDPAKPMPQDLPPTPEWEVYAVYRILQRAQTADWFQAQAEIVRDAAKALLRQEAHERAGKPIGNLLGETAIPVLPLISPTPWNPEIAPKASAYLRTIVLEIIRETVEQVRKVAPPESTLLKWEGDRRPLEKKDIAVAFLTRGSRDVEEFRALVGPQLVKIIDSPSPFGFTLIQYVVPRTGEIHLRIVFYLEDLIVNEEGEIRSDARIRLASAFAMAFFGAAKPFLACDLKKDLISLRTEERVEMNRSLMPFVMRWMQSSYGGASDMTHIENISRISSAEMLVLSLSTSDECAKLVGGDPVPIGNPNNN